MKSKTKSEFIVRLWVKESKNLSKWQKNNVESKQNFERWEKEFKKSLLYERATTLIDQITKKKSSDFFLKSTQDFVQNIRAPTCYCYGLSGLHSSFRYNNP